MTSSKRLRSNMESWAWKANLKPHPKLVLLRLLQYADTKGVCSPSPAVKTIAHDCGLSESTVHRAIKALQVTTPPCIAILRRPLDTNLYQVLYAIGGVPLTPLLLTTSTTGVTQTPSPWLARRLRQAELRAARIAYKVGYADSERKHEMEKKA